MDLNQLQIYPRVRNHWSAIDMGVRLARRWYKDLFWGWFLGASLALVVLSLCFFWAPWAIFLGFWWIKPLLDRLPLFVGSRRLFGQHLTLRQAIKQGWPHLRRDFFLLLTWRRLSPSRSFDQPVTVLENLKGARRQRRLQQLHNAGFTQSCWLTWVCACFEAAGYVACYALMFLMIPESYQVEFSDLMEGDGVVSNVLSTLITLLVASAVAPFYVMGGFLLYLNRRIALEGWDIELQFRALAQRLELHEERMGGSVLANPSETPPTGSGLVAVLPLIFMLSFMGAGAAYAPHAVAEHRSGEGPVTETMEEFVREIAPKPESERARVRQTMEEILSGSDFHGVRLENRWQRRGIDDEPPLVHSEWSIRFIEWLEKLEFLEGDGSDNKNKANLDFFLSFANVLEIMLWAALVIVVGILLYRYRDVLLEMIAKISNRPIPEGGPPPATEIQGLDIRPDSLPDDVPTQVRNLVKSGDSRQALALLYRASLSRLAHRWQVPFAGHHTESDCLQLVKSRDFSENVPASQRQLLATLFSGVVQLWTHRAYGHEEPDVIQLERTLSQWPEVFDRE